MEITMFDKLMKKINYAKSSVSARELLYQAYGNIEMARELEALTLEEFFKLNHECVAEGINNPKYF